MDNHAGAVNAYIGYAREDAAWLDELETHLALLHRQGLIAAWTDRRIEAGGEVAKNRGAGLRRSELVLLLVSPDFMASDTCIDMEMTEAIERHKLGRSRVVPIIVRASDWRSSPLGALQAVPRDGRPISAWRDRDAAWVQVIGEIRIVLASIQLNRAPHAEAAARSPEKATWTTGAIRDALNRTLRTAADFEAFCLDHFPEIHQRFTAGMDRLERQILLLTAADHAEIMARLSGTGSR